MPMMVLSDDKFTEEMSKFCSGSSKLVNSNETKPNSDKEPIVARTEPGGKVIDILRGRGTNRVEIPNSVRILVAEEAINGTKAKQVSEAFGISESSISAYKRDATSTASYDTPNKDLQEANNIVRENITEQARSKLLSALAHVTDEKLAEAKLRDVAAVANSMSGIIKNMEPNGPSQVNNTQVIVYKPRMRDEDEFEVITVNE
jgi:transposase